MLNSHIIILFTIMMRSDKGTIEVPIGPFRGARAKRFKGNLNGLIQHIWAEENLCRSKEDISHGSHGWIFMIQALEQAIF